MTQEPKGQPPKNDQWKMTPEQWEAELEEVREFNRTQMGNGEDAYKQKLLALKKLGLPLTAQSMSIGGPAVDPGPIPPRIEHPIHCEIFQLIDRTNPPNMPKFREPQPGESPEAHELARAETRTNTSNRQ